MKKASYMIQAICLFVIAGCGLVIVLEMQHGQRLWILLVNTVSIAINIIIFFFWQHDRSLT